MLKCYCMTYSSLHNTTLVGSCMYTCRQDLYLIYYRVPKSLQQLNNATCGPHKRQGQLCSYCWDGHAPSVYSYDHYCANCTAYKQNWIKYLSAAYLPVTLAYLVILCFRVNIARSFLYAHVLTSQLMTTKQVASLLDVDRLHTAQAGVNVHHYSQQVAMFKAIFTTFGIWNLDFGRLLYKPFCLHPDLTMHQVIALDYLIAVYPLLLILLTYLLVKLHDSYRLAVLLWKPFHWCIRRIQKEWNVKASLIDVFATFLLLSNVKLLNVSFDLISVPLTLWEYTGSAIPTTYTYLNGSLEYLGKEHLPYFVLGVTVITVFNVLPILLLCLYPFRWFQRCLNHCSLSSASLHIFMDAFQGCYKTSPRDYRQMASLPLIAMLLNFIAFSSAPNYNAFALLGYIMGIVCFVVVLCRPYKKNNDVYGFTYLASSFLSFSLLGMNKEYLPSNNVLPRLGNYINLRLDILFLILIVFTLLFGVFRHILACAKPRLVQLWSEEEATPLV